MRPKTNKSRSTGRARRSRPRRLPQPTDGRRGSLRLGLALLALIGINIYFFVMRDGTSIPDVMERAAMAGQLETRPIIDLDEDLGAADVQDQTPVAEDEQEEEEDEGFTVSGTVGPGDSLTSILVKHGLDNRAAHAVISSLDGHIDFKQIHPGQVYRLRLTSGGVLTAFEFQVNKVLAVRATRDASGAMVTQKQRAPTQIVESEVSGRVTSSLYQAIKDANEDTRLVGFFVDVFAYDLNFYVDTHPGDSFRMVIEKEFLDGEFLRYGSVLAAEYRGLAGTFRAIRFDDEYWNEDAESVAKTFLKTPLKFTRISSKYNPRRMHPVLHRRRGHFGVDYAAPRGTPIWAAAGGKIVFRGRRGGAGNCVILRHESGYTTLYMHMSKFRKGQRVGSRVKQKEVIGYVGSTGLATGPHLHFGLKKKGRYVDPLKIKMSRTERVPKARRAEFDALAKRMLDRLEQVSVDAPAP